MNKSEMKRILRGVLEMDKDKGYFNLYPHFSGYIKEDTEEYLLIEGYSFNPLFNTNNSYTNGIMNYWIECNDKTKAVFNRIDKFEYTEIGFAEVPVPGLKVSRKYMHIRIYKNGAA